MKAALVTVLLLHGGGWAGGDASMLEPQADMLRARGYPAYSVPYERGKPRVVVSSVRRYVRQARRDHGGKVILWGQSAGGHVAAYLAARGEVDGAVVFSGPTDLLSWSSAEYPWGHADLWRAFGMSRWDRKRLSPARRVGKRTAPMLLLYGDADTIVHYEQGVILRDQAVRYQRDVRLVRMRGVPHAMEPWRRYEPGAADWIENRWPTPLSDS